MSCSKVKRLCNNLIISQAVTFADGTLIVNLPAGTYNNCQKYCIVIAQTIPVEATIVAPVVITIGADTTQYPLLNCDCTQVTACSINTRTRYTTVVRTDTTTGAFRLTGKLPCSRCANNLASLPVTETPAGG